VRATGARFGCALGDAEYGKAAAFCRGLLGWGPTWALGILPAQKVFPAEVTLAPRPPKGTGRPARHPVPSAPSVEAAKLFAALPRRAFRPFSWRRGTKGPLKARFAAVRVRVADGPVAARARHLPGEEAWLVREERAAAGERKYHLTNHPADAPLRTLAATIKARWAHEQMHQQMKQGWRATPSNGLDHFEGRGWRGLRHHVLLCQIAYAFLQHLQLGGNAPPGTTPPARHPRPRCPRCGGACSPRCSPTSPDISDAVTGCRTIRFCENGRVVLGPVDTRGSPLGWAVIQGWLFGGGLGSDGPSGAE
jgi:SRSO17 transposase